MTNPEQHNTENTFGPLTEEEAVGVMEGRLPANDTRTDHEGAAAMMHALLIEPDDLPREKRGGNVMQFVRRQPWMQMAAGLALGVAVTTAFIQDPPAEGPGLASANVLHLESLRSSDLATIASVRIDGAEQWLSLVTYPDFSGADSLRVFLERSTDPEPTSVASLLAGGWESVMESSAGAGTRETVVVTVAAADLQPGYHRLRIQSDTGDGQLFETSQMFRVVR